MNSFRKDQIQQLVSKIEKEVASIPTVEESAVTIKDLFKETLRAIYSLQKENAKLQRKLRKQAREQNVTIVLEQVE